MIQFAKHLFLSHLSVAFSPSTQKMSSSDWPSSVGGVCPFGLPHPLKIFVDVTVKKFDVVLPAAGATNAALRIAPDRLTQLVQATWVDVAQERP
jgi:hypothetical protein